MVWWMRFKHWQAEKYGLGAGLPKRGGKAGTERAGKETVYAAYGPDGVLPPLFRICSGAGSVQL